MEKQAAEQQASQLCTVASTLTAEHSGGARCTATQAPTHSLPCPPTLIRPSWSPVASSSESREKAAASTCR